MILSLVYSEEEFILCSTTFFFFNNKITIYKKNKDRKLNLENIYLTFRKIGLAFLFFKQKNKSTKLTIKLKIF